MIIKINHLPIDDFKKVLEEHAAGGYCLPDHADMVQAAACHAGQFIQQTMDATPVTQYIYNYSSALTFDAVTYGTGLAKIGGAVAYGIGYVPYKAACWAVPAVSHAAVNYWTSLVADTLKGLSGGG